MPAFITQTAVRVVLDDDEVVFVRKLEQALAALGRHGHTTGILEIRNGVEELQPRVVLANAFELFLEQVRAHALIVEGNRADVGLVSRESLQRTEVRGTLGDDDVAGVAERLRNEIERLLSTRRNDDVLGLVPDAEVANEVAEHLRRFEQAVRATVLERNGLIVDCRFGRLAHGALGQKRYVGHAACKRDDIITLRSGEQQPDC